MSCDKCLTRSSIADTNVTVIAGLIPGVDYKFNVAAVNAFGKGQDSVNVNVQSATPGMNHKLYCIYYVYTSAFMNGPPTSSIEWATNFEY